MIYITADPHGDFSHIANFCAKMETTTADILIILGDVGLNYYLKGWQDHHRKKQVAKLPITLFCIHGNHEARPSSVPSYKLIDWHGGKVWVEDDFPNLLFAKDGEIYQFGDKKCIVLGGAYSVDKYYRLAYDMQWFADEQPSDEIKAFAESQLEANGWKVDVVFSHTCPFKYEPIEWFLANINQSKVDKTTEKWLDEIEEKLDYQKWYCGHFHGNKRIDKMEFLYETFVVLE